MFDAGPDKLHAAGAPVLSDLDGMVRAESGEVSELTRQQAATILDLSQALALYPAQVRP